jgi:hypothetical protein
MKLVGWAIGWIITSYFWRLLLLFLSGHLFFLFLLHFMFCWCWSLSVHASKLNISFIKTCNLLKDNEILSTWFFCEMAKVFFLISLLFRDEKVRHQTNTTKLRMYICLLHKCNKWNNNERIMDGWMDRDWGKTSKTRMTARWGVTFVGCLSLLKL